MLTFCLFHKGVSGMPAAGFRSIISPYPDNDSHANPYVTNNLPLCAILLLVVKQLSISANEVS